MNKTYNLKEKTEKTIINMEKQLRIHQDKQAKAIPVKIQGGKYGSSIAKDSQTGVPVLVDVDDALVEDVLKRVRSHGGAEKRWDVNQVEGEIGEGTVAALMNATGNTVEVKRDFKASETGNFAVEFMCGGKPSGISTSESEWWAIVLDGEYYNGEVILFIKKKRLERLLNPKRTVRGGDHNKAEMFLIRIEELVQRMRGVS